jgi:hypothetical protein
VEKANTADNTFVEQAMEQSKAALDQPIENAHADGAYNSQSNMAYCKDNAVNFYLTGIQGSEGRYDLEPTEQGSLTVTDSQTGETIAASETKNGKWKIKTEQGARYFSTKEIESCQLRKQIANLPSAIKYKRNNVEATIFQLSLHNRNNKTKYRGKIKQKMWAAFRCLWINLVRIKKHVEQICQRTSKTAENGTFNERILKNVFYLPIQRILFRLYLFFIYAIQRRHIYIFKNH